jgi:signal transduction histidine kinase/ligand-binding sensor domain-containing protein
VSSPRPIFPRPPLRRFLRRLAPLLAAALAAAAHGQGDYFYRTWRIDNGLTDNSVNTVVQDPRGYVWLATLFGLARFDGRQFEEFPLPAPLRESGENIRALAQEDPGTLVMLPASGGVVRFRDGRFERHPVDAAAQGRHLLQLYVAADGVLWLADSAGEVMRWQQGRLAVFGKADGLEGGSVGLSVATDARGRTWLAEGGFLGWYEDGRLVRYPGPVGTALVIAPAQTGGIWISSAERLLRWDDGRLTALAGPPEWVAGRNVVQHLFEDSRGILWIGTRRDGLYQLVGGEVRKIPTQQQFISWIAEDSEHGIWTASHGDGIARLQRQRFVTIRPAPDRADIASTAVYEDPTGAVWCANRDGGVFRYFAGTVEHVPDPAGEPPIYANSVCADAAGTVWVGAAGGLYRVVGGRTPRLARVAPEVAHVHAIFLSRQGELWISSGYNRLGRLRQDRFEDLTASQGYPGTAVTALAETADGTLWISLETGLYAFRDGRLVREAAYTPPYPGERICALYGDPTGALWIGTARGLIRLKDGRLTVYTQANGLPNDRIEQILEDGNGLLWLNSRRGFFHVSRADLEAVAAGRLERVEAVSFGPEEGLSGEIPVFNCQPDTWRGGGNRLWFCTQEGVIGIDANAVPRALPPPPVYIDRVRIDGRDAPAAGLRVPTRVHRLSFSFSSPSYAAPEKVRLRYRLNGFDSGWIETASDRVAVFSELPPGRYTLDVAASDPTGIWQGQIGASLPFVVTARWWETPWARLLALAAFTGCIVALARYTSHRLLRRRLVKMEREHALEKERARIARDLHDDLGGSLTQIGLLADRLKRLGARGELEQGLGQLARRTRQLAGELESIIWTVNPRNNSLDRFALFVRQFTPRFFRDTGIETAVVGAEEIPPLPLAPEVQHHLLTATKEALTNALKHSQATLVVVELHWLAGDFTMQIRDDGIGFDPTAPEINERNGLANIRSRLGEIGGAVEIHSSAGAGTVVAWRVPLTDRRAARRATAEL